MDAKNGRTTSIRATRALVAAVGAVTVMVLTLSACGSGGRSGQSQTSSATSHPSTSAPAPATSNASDQFNHHALEIFDAIVRGDYTAATTRFDTLMREKLSPEALGSAWKSYQQSLGGYQSHGDPTQVARGDLTVVNVPLVMQQEPGQFRVTFHNDDGSVDGLYFLRAGVPVP